MKQKFETPWYTIYIYNVITSSPTPRRGLSKKWLGNTHILIMAGTWQSVVCIICIIHAVAQTLNVACAIYAYILHVYASWCLNNVQQYGLEHSTYFHKPFNEECVTFDILRIKSRSLFKKKKGGMWSQFINLLTPFVIDHIVSSIIRIILGRKPRQSGM